MTTRWAWLLAGGLCLTLAGCCSRRPIGAAEMEPDGTLVLWLRAEGGVGLVGHGLLRYAPDHPEYERHLSHVGGLRPGESKLVPPYCE